MATKTLRPKTSTKKFTRFRPMILSRHPSHNVLRLASKNLEALPVRSVVRFGSITEVADTVANGGQRIEVNTIQSIKNSSSKRLMKQKFVEAGVKCAEQWIDGDLNDWCSERYPIVAKAHHGSQGRGNTLIKSCEELDSWMVGKTIGNYIFEKFMNFGHEFRLHMTADGCFYSCRKALKKDVPEDQKWRRHDDICVWLLETNPEFHKPNSWNDIEADCVKALKAIGADILSFDVKVQTPRNGNGELRPYQEYILIECNSASSMDNGSGELSICAQKYIEVIPQVIRKKIK